MSFIQEAHNDIDASATTIVITLAGVAAGSTITVFYGGSTAASTDLTGVSDPSNGTYTILDRLAATGTAVGSFCKENVIGGSLTITAAYATSVGFRRMYVREDSAAASALDGHNAQVSTAFGSGTDAVTSPSITTTANGDTIIGYVEDDTSATIPTIGTGFTGRAGWTNAAGDGHKVEDKAQSTAGAVASTYTNANATDQQFVFVVALKAVAAASAGSLNQFGQACL